VRVSRGDLDGALEAFEESLAVRRGLSASDPRNTQWQRDVSVSLDKVGGVRVSRGDVDGALEVFEESLAVRRRLSASDPRNTQWRYDIAASHFHLHRIADRSKQPELANEHRRECHRVLVGMRTAGMHLDAWATGFLKQFDAHFGTEE